MHTGQNFSFKEVVVWTKHDIGIFVIIATVPTVCFEVYGYKWLALPWLPIALLGTALAIIVGFQNNATYDRLWEARKIYGAIVNSSRIWAMLVKAYITDKYLLEPLSKGELETIYSRLILRQIAWLTALRHQLRQSREWETVNKIFHIHHKQFFIVPEHEIKLEVDLIPYLAAAEMEYTLQKKNPAAHIIDIQSKELKKLFNRGLIEKFNHIELQNVLSDLYVHQGKCERIKNFPYPRQFSTLNLYFVWLFILLLPFGMLPEFEKFGHHIVWLTIPFCVMISWIFHTMDKIGESTENPFQGAANDVPITAISRNIEIDLLEMLGETDLPEPIEPKNKILM